MLHHSPALVIFVIVLYILPFLLIDVLSLFNSTPWAYLTRNYHQMAHFPPNYKFQNLALKMLADNGKCWMYECRFSVILHFSRMFYTRTRMRRSNLLPVVPHLHLGHREHSWTIILLNSWTIFCLFVEAYVLSIILQRYERVLTHTNYLEEPIAINYKFPYCQEMELVEFHMASPGKLLWEMENNSLHHLMLHCLMYLISIYNPFHVD